METKYHVLPSNINTKITKWLPNSSFIYSVESKAIDLALNFITQIEFTKFIFSGSLSVLRSLKKQQPKTWIIP